MSPVPEEERDKPTQNNSSEIEDTEYPDVVINVDSSDSDDDGGDGEDGYMGYQTLPQDIGGPDSDSEEMTVGHSTEVETSLTSQQTAHGPEVPTGLLHSIGHEDFPNSTNLPGYMQVPEVPRPDKAELLWNQPASTDIKLDTGQTDKIKSLMSSIQLPPTNIPDWAKSLSEDQWQAQVVTRLLSKRTSPKQEVDISSSKKTVDSPDTDTNENS